MIYQGGCTPNQHKCPGLWRAQGWTAGDPCPCLSLFLGLQSVSSSFLLPLSSDFPPLLSPSSVTSTWIWGSRGSESHKLQPALSASSTALSPWWLMPGCSCLLLVLSVFHSVFFLCFVSPLSSSHLTFTMFVINRIQVETSLQEKKSEYKVCVVYATCITAWKWVLLKVLHEE